MSVLNNDGGFYMPVAPAYGGASGGFGNGWGSDSWLLLILILCFGGGWGGFGGFGGGAMGMDMFPYFYNTQTQNDVNRGFDNAALANQITGIQSAVTSGFGDTALGIAGINQNICSTGNGIVNAITNGNNALTQQMYTNQIADLERSFAAQTASTHGMNALQSQLAQCCCENRAATADVKYTIATENCQDRYAAAQNTRDIIENANRNNQAILDKLCALELDNYKRENDNLRQRLNMASLGASQNAQTAQIEYGQRALANEIEQYVNPTPKPAYIVQNPACCNAYQGCGGF